MYPPYFGLNEPPFSITPDPHFLFLSQRHQEALAHLLYGAGESGGFVQLTGEVGTGKTTVCRAFLEQLPESVDVALIVNPSLSVRELLHAICDEFGIPIPTANHSKKVLFDRLTQYLLEAHARGRRPLLMIDEAQNLGSNALEQIRLLTNLETDKHKLLQIFLIGQPELRNLLEKKDLRQVAQRITARYHLLPLGPKETREYIHHRLRTAGAEQNPFTNRAIRRIYRFSGGIPRLINILCDRSLLGAYATHQRVVDTNVVAKAARELMGKYPRKHWVLATVAGLASLSLGVGLTAFYLMGTPEIGTTHTEDTQRLPHSVVPGAAILDPVKASAKEEPLRRQNVQHRTDKTPAAPIPKQIKEKGDDWPSAMNRLFARWGLDFPAQRRIDPCRYAVSKGLRCLKGRATWENLRRHKRPALLQFKRKNGNSAFLLVIGLDESRVILDFGSSEAELPLNALDPRNFEQFTLLWRPPGKDIGLISSGASPESVIWLRRTLDQAPDFSIPDLESGEYDAALKAEVVRFQRSRGLVSDGIVGPQTLIQLNTAIGRPGTPTLEI